MSNKELQPSDQSRDLFRLVAENVEDFAVYVKGLDGHVLSWNPGVERLLGYAEDEWVGRHVSIIFTPEDRALGEPGIEMRMALAEGRSEDQRWHVRRDGSRFWANGLLMLLRDEAGAPRAFAKIMRDDSARKRLEDELRRSKEELKRRVEERTRELSELTEALLGEVKERKAAEWQVRELLRRIVDAQEIERKRIARDLHDDLGQLLTALRLSLDSITGEPLPPAAVKERIERTHEVARRIENTVDFIAWELRPAALDTFGLDTAVGNFVREWSKHYGVPAQFSAVGPDGSRPKTEVEINLYRIAQEALNNIHKHAEAGRVEVLLERRDGELVLIVEDDGKGFEPGRAVDGDKGMGLLSMRERAAQVGGTLEIESGPGSGTTVYARVPVGATA